MTQIFPYLTFNGNCREAMSFYQSCLGGKLNFLTIGGSPLAQQMPEPMKNSILHSSLVHRAIVMQGSDMVPESGITKGNSVSLSMNASSEAEVRLLYEKLSEGGHRDHELEHTFLGALFGDLTDKFGNHWLLHYDKNQLK